MGASFRSKAQILALAGCDYLTISPNLLTELSKSTEEFPRKLDKESAHAADIAKVSFDEKSFRWEMGKDQCGTVKLAVCQFA